MSCIVPGGAYSSVHVLVSACLVPSDPAANVPISISISISISLSLYIYIYIYIYDIICVYALYIYIYTLLRCSLPACRPTVSFHNLKSQNFKLSVSNPKNKYVAVLSVLSQISNCQGLGRKKENEILKTDRMPLLVQFRRNGVSGSRNRRHRAANPRTKNLDFRCFDSSRFLISIRGGIPQAQRRVSQKPGNQRFAACGLAVCGWAGIPRPRENMVTKTEILY